MSYETNQNARSRKTRVLLWIAQALLAALFLFAGGMKLVVPLEVMEKQTDLPGLFIQFIGVAEVLGGLGLILPGLLRIRPALTSLAAAGLLIIMFGATILTAATAGIEAAIFPQVTGVICALIAYGRATSRLTLRREHHGAVAMGV